MIYIDFNKKETFPEIITEISGNYKTNKSLLVKEDSKSINNTWKCILRAFNISQNI
jgi:hypothetical protein